ncbi:hypothetical protein NYZ99_07245 [Maribacter litopenaei]|uniref:Uncharacterized protein n=1 Tax=Maribacter litopenaei TaxID=2976127 RepID=A0ABY5YAM7_9FLAO|nr:hypothetical protein [Maribacter litopenaei]UWX56092.1 hypothetical protein NYZ99_07245 [Maribacter litopenaei]
MVFGLFYEDIDEEKIKDFYKVYIGTMDRRDAIDSFYHPVSYFIELRKVNPKKCAIGLVYYEGKPISRRTIFDIRKYHVFFFGRNGFRIF